RWTLGGLLAVWILVALGEGGPVEFLVLGALGALVGYWLGGRAERRRAAAAAPPASDAADGAPPDRPSRWNSWRRERPIFSGMSLGCGCLALVFVGLAMIFAFVLSGRRDQARTPFVYDSSHLDQPLELGLLETFHVVSVPFDLSFKSVMPDRALQAPSEERRGDYVFPAWPPLLGGLGSNPPDEFDFEIAEGSDPEWADDRAVMFDGRLRARYASRGTQTLLCPDGIAAEGGVTAQGYCTVLVAEGLAGRCVFDSYATLLVDGILSGSVEAKSYFNALITRDLSGRFVGQEYSLLYIRGRLRGSIEFGADSKLYIEGRTTRSDLERITGKAAVLLRDSDLEPGVHEIGQLTVTVLP
ncbi:MAG TPA: hypothetical protein VES36_01470, partial [Candidatus Limnocylindrales bacterium]|nr:hypothetical protein [Candidatus Limnocylindrales bacterium]